MASYLVFEPPAPTDEEAVERARLIRDGVCVPGFLITPLWLLWHRLWIEAAIVFATGIGIAAAADAAGLGPAGSVLQLLLSVYVGLEGQGLRAAALRRRGWHEWGLVEAGSLDDAEARYAAGVAGDHAPAHEVTAPPPFPQTPAQSPRRGSGPALGLLSYPGRG